MTSSIRSSSRSMSNRWLGGTARQPVGVSSTLHSSASRMRRTSASSISRPSTRARRCAAQRHRFARRGRSSGCSAPSERARAAAGQLDQQLAGALQRQARQLRVDATLEAVRGIGVQAQLARAPADRGRREMCAFQEHVARGVGDAGGQPAHDAGHGQRRRLVGDHQELGGQLDLAAVEQGQFLALDRRGAPRWRPAACRCRRRAAAGRFPASRSWSRRPPR